MPADLDPPRPGRRSRDPQLDRRILSLAVPALGALVAEPLLILTDTALVGHLGGPVLAGLGVASTVLQTVVGLMVFLAYTTTPVVARRLGAGDRPGALRAGIEGMWLGLAAGTVLALAGLPAAPWLVGLLTPHPAAAAEAHTYLAISLAGLPAMLLVVAATGLLRGLQDTRTPLIVAVAGAAVNAALNAVLIYGAGLGIAGAALGTVLVQWAMAATYLAIAARAARAAGVPMAPGLGPRGATLRASGWMMLRTVTLRIAIVAVVFVGGRLGVDELAALQVLFVLYNLTAFALDALAIAGQALVGHGLGAGDRMRVRATTRRLEQWGVGFGAVLCVAFAAAAPWLGHVFTSDEGVLALLPWGVVTLALTLPLAGYVFVLDGILIGAGDARYLAVAGVWPALGLLVLLAATVALASALAWPAGTAFVAVWGVFGVGYLGGRAATLWWRARGDAWLVLGASR